jgi:hypothetical protein
MTTMTTMTDAAFARRLQVGFGHCRWEEEQRERRNQHPLSLQYHHPAKSPVHEMGRRAYTWVKWTDASPMPSKSQGGMEENHGRERGTHVAEAQEQQLDLALQGQIRASPLTEHNEQWKQGRGGKQIKSKYGKSMNSG